MCPFDYEVWRSRSWGIGNWNGTELENELENGFQTITDSVIHLWSWNFIHLLPMSPACALLILGSKGQGHGAFVIENGFWNIADSVIDLWSWNFIHLLPMSQGCAILILGSKGQGHRALVIENGFRTITDFVIHLWSWNFTYLLIMIQVSALFILGSKVQIDFGVKSSKVKVMGHWWLKNGLRTITDYSKMRIFSAKFILALLAHSFHYAKISSVLNFHEVYVHKTYENHRNHKTLKRVDMQYYLTIIVNTLQNAHVHIHHSQNNCKPLSCN